jgi:hypothetical protein
MLHFIRRSTQKRLVSYRVFAEYARYDPKKRSSEDNFKFLSEFLATAQSYATRYRQKLSI